MSHDLHSPSADAFPLVELGLDPFETDLLAILRHFFAAFTRPDSQAWQTAFAMAGERWGEALGPQIAAGGLGLLQSLRKARQREFTFANPLCRGCREMVTGDEAHLMRMVQALRRDRTDLARPEVQALTEGTMDPVLIRSGLAFAARHPADQADFGNDLPKLAAQQLRLAEPLPAPTHDNPAPRRAGHLRLVH